MTKMYTVKDVELIDVGMDWETMTGKFTFTPADLVSAIESQNDPAVRPPIIKLGHTDPRFDGQPALGKVINLRLENNGMTLVGDLAGLPAWMVETDDDGNPVIAAAFPRRSIEGIFGAKTHTGNEWDLVLTGVALLGTAYPAITTLDDIAALWDDQPPTLVPVEETLELVAAATPPPGVSGTPIMATLVPKHVAATLSIEDIRRAYYAQRSGVTRYTWVREIRVDPLELIVDDDEGGVLYSVPVNISGDEITFGEPQAVKIEYVNASRRLVVAHWDREPSSVHEHDASMRDPDTNHNHQEAPTMLSKEALEKLGLPADADDEAINAAILQASSEGEPVAAGLTVPEGMALIDTATLDELRQGTVLAKNLHQEQLDRERDTLIDDAISAGKIPPARRDHYVAMFAADREGAKTVLATLAPGLVPVTESGSGNDQNNTEADAAYPESWGRTVSAANRRTGSVRITGGND